MEKVSLIIPVYNEEKTIQRVINESSKVLSGCTACYEIIVMDDGSFDNTLAICKELEKANPFLRVVQSNENRGKTKTILEGAKLAKWGVLAFIDADYQYHPKDLPKVISEIEKGYDLCSGWRRDRDDNFYRRLFSFCFNTFNKAMFGIRLHDINCGMKAFRKILLEEIDLKYLNAGWFIDTELLAKAYNNHLKVCEVVISHSKREEGQSKVSCIKLATETITYGILLKLSFMLGK